MATDGAPTKSSGADDPVLAGAVSEMVSEGALQPDQSFEPAATADGASQATSDASAATATSPTTGDGGSSSVGGSPNTAAPDPTVTPAASAANAADPLDGTEPFTYTVNGEQRTLKGIYRVPGEGLMVPEAEVASVQALAERADLLDRATRDMLSERADFQRLSTWQTTGPDGKPHSISGQQAWEAMRVEHAQQAAALTILDQLLADPAQFARLVAVNDKNQIVVDPLALDYLKKDIALAATGAASSARSEFQTLRHPAAPTASSTSIDFAKQAPAVIAEAAGAQLASLTQKDREFLAGQLPRYIRTVTEQDRLYSPNLTIGSPIVSEVFTHIVKDRIELRAEAAKAAKVAEQVGKHNAGMDKGRQPAKQAPKPTTPIPASPPADARKKADWDTPLSTALAEMGVPR